jgi:hypothetical protein
MTSKYVRTLYPTLVMAADTIAGYIKGLLNGEEYSRTTYALDHATRREALSLLLNDFAKQSSPQTRSAQQLSL